MDSAKQQYDELVSSQSWDKETQIRYFLEYAEEYQLSAHFLAYLALKQPAIKMQQHPAVEVDKVKDKYRFGARG